VGDRLARLVRNVLEVLWFSWTPFYLTAIIVINITLNNVFYWLDLSIHKLLVVFLPFCNDIVYVLAVVRQGRVNLTVGSVLEFYVFDFIAIDLGIGLNC
jgi:hypothetical protein